MAHVSRHRAIVMEGVLGAALVAGALLLAEAALQAASRASRYVERLLAAPWEVSAPVVPDERLVYRGNPLMPGHDDAGYRNERRLARADVVTLGDSMTYGPVDPRDAWPRVLADVTGRQVYNMALPGYGPGQSLFQLEAALALRPTVVIVAPYFGNDLPDAFTMAQRHPALVAALAPGLVQRANDLEAQRRLEQDLASPFTVGVDGTEQQVTRLRRWTSEHVKLFNLVRAIKNRVTAAAPPDPLLSRDFAVAVGALTPTRRESLSPFVASGWRTILAGGYRGHALDDHDPRIRVGFLVMCAALEGIAEQTRAANARVIMVLFPTKESVFWPLVADVDSHPGLHAMVTNEARLRAELTARLRKQGVEILDLLDVLRNAKEQPYYEDVDGHPNPAGHRLIAAAVADVVASGRR